MDIVGYSKLMSDQQTKIINIPFQSTLSVKMRWISLVFMVISTSSLVYAEETKTSLVKVFVSTQNEIEYLKSQGMCIRYKTNNFVVGNIPSLKIDKIGKRYTILSEDIKDKDYFLVLVRGDQIDVLADYGEVLDFDGQTAIVQMRTKESLRLCQERGFKIKKIPERIYPKRAPPLHLLKTPIFTSQEDTEIITKILNSISTNTIGEYIQLLQDFKTRYSFAPGCDQAGDYIYSIYSQFQGYGLEVEYDSFQNGDKINKNVIATLRGKTLPDKVYIICAHYDSMSNNPYNSAPGADDNGSGVAAVLAAAKILSQYEFNFTIKFIAFAGEEQGLIGSREYAEDAHSNNSNIMGVINLDMIGYWKEGIKYDLEVIGDRDSEWLVDYLIWTNDKYLRMPITKVVDDGAWWGDHSSFWDNGYSALLGTEAYNWYAPDFNPYYHTVEETLDKLDLDFATKIAKISIATVCELADPYNDGPPQLTITEPDGVRDIADTVYRITWVGGISESIFLYYDIDTDCQNGVLIAECNTTAGHYIWNTSSLPEGRYYIYAVDGQDSECSSGPVTIEHTYSNLERVIVYPNPFKPDVGHQEIVFDNLAHRVTIKIYTLAGERVKEIEINEEPKWRWNVRNEQGQRVASGVYIYLITDGSGNRKTGKIAIIR